MIAGLEPYAEMKDSGIEWLGEVPVHWGVERLKGMLASVVDHAAALPHGSTAVALENVESWTGKVDTGDSLSSFDGQLKRFRSGDVLFCRLRPYLAKVARPMRDGLCVGEFLVLRPRNGQVLGPYFEQLLRSKPIIDAVTGSTYGAKMPRANWGFIGGMRVVHPRFAEQAAIVRFLDHATGSMDAAVRSSRRQIECLREYRTRLIADVVAGKLDVREAAAGLPEIDALPGGDEPRGDEQAANVSFAEPAVAGAMTNGGATFGMAAVRQAGGAQV